MDKIRIGINSMLVILILLFSSNVFAVKVDGVRSKHIKEADGTTGQNTNRGSGVKTGHIQDGAVTDAKISDVSMEKVTGLDSALAAKADQTAVDAAIANIELTPGPMGPVGPQGPQGDAGADGAVGPGAVYGNMTVVATTGGEYTSLVNAMDDISSWCGPANPNTRCLVKIMPGTYVLFGGILSIPAGYAHVGIEGSGEFSTKIIGGIHSINGDPEAHVLIRNLSIERTSGNAIQFTDYAGLLDISNVTITAIDNGIYTKCKILSVDNVTINMSAGDGIYFGQFAISYNMNSLSQSGSVFLNNVDINIDSTEYGPVYGVSLLGNSHMTMRNSSIKIKSVNSTREAWGLRFFKNWNYSLPVVTKISNVDISVASDSTEAAAIAFAYITNEVFQIDNVRAKATATGLGTTASAVVTKVSDAGSSVEINHSILSGDDFSITKRSDPMTFSVGSSQLIGPISVDPAAALNCFGNYDGAYTDVSCP